MKSKISALLNPRLEKVANKAHKEGYYNSAQDMQNIAREYCECQKLLKKLFLREELEEIQNQAPLDVFMADIPV